MSYEEGREIKREASGSGTIITPEGHVLTNHHVAGHTKSIICTLPIERGSPADLVGTDPLSDIAIIKLRPAKPRVFPVARFGDARKLKVGDPVMALGSPLALSQSVTMGIVSNTEMIMPGMFWPFNRMTLDGEDVGSIVRWIGHDAADLRRQLRRAARQHVGRDRRRQRDQHGTGGGDPERPRAGSGDGADPRGPGPPKLDRSRHAAAVEVVEQSSTARSSAERSKDRRRPRRDSPPAMCS